MENTAFNVFLWADVIAGVAVVMYGYFAWATIRGWINPSARMVFAVRFLCVIALLLPFGARFQYNEKTILVISTIIVCIGLIIRLRNKWGI